MITLVKFIKNKQDDAPPNNKVISRTLGKTGVLSWEHITSDELIPQAEEFWYVEVLKEIGAGTPKGVFILRPIQKVSQKTKGDGPDITHMIPGTYTSEVRGNTILLYPKILNYPDSLGPNWICSLVLRRKLMNKYREGNTYKVNSIIVVFDGATTWDREEIVKKSSVPERRDVPMSPD